MDAAVHAGGNFLLNKLELLKDHPLLTPFALSAWFEGLKFQYGTLQGDEIVRTPWAVHFRDGIDLTPAYNIEFAFSIDINNPTKAVKAIRVVLWTTTVYALCGKCNVWLDFYLIPNRDENQLTCTQHHEINAYKLSILP